MQQRLAVITGSSKGIGEACARRFLAEGVTVVGISTSPPDEPLYLMPGSIRWSATSPTLTPGHR